MSSLKHFIKIAFWLFCFGLILIFAYYEDFSQLIAELQATTSISQSFLRKLLEYFSFADTWNYLTLLGFLSVLLILFTINDLLLEKRFYTKNQVIKGTLSGKGIRWLSHKATSAILVFVQFVILANAIIYLNSWSQIEEDSAKVNSQYNAALLLGTNKHLRQQPGAINLYYQYRIDATVKLYKQGKIKKIIISGDNSTLNYNEPADMRNDLVKRGVALEDIELDFAGFRTLDSIVRLKYHFKINEVIIISQRFHIERALMLAWYYNVNAQGFAAEGSMNKAMIIRELLAKPKVLIDIFVLNMQPRYGKAPGRKAFNTKSEEDLLIMFLVGLLATSSGFLASTSLSQTNHK